MLEEEQEEDSESEYVGVRKIVTIKLSKQTFYKSDSLFQEFSIALNSESEPIVVKFCVDTGAERSTITEELSDTLKAKIKTDKNFKISGFDGTLSNSVIGYIKDINLRCPEADNPHVKFNPLVVRGAKENLLKKVWTWRKRLRRDLNLKKEKILSLS